MRSSQRLHRAMRSMSILTSVIQPRGHLRLPEPRLSLFSLDGQSQQSRLEFEAVSQLSTRTGERSGLLTHIATTVNASLCVQMKS
jgi:hypothetical protein